MLRYCIAHYHCLFCWLVYSLFLLILKDTHTRIVWKWDAGIQLVFGLAFCSLHVVAIGGGMDGWKAWYGMVWYGAVCLEVDGSCKRTFVRRDVEISTHYFKFCDTLDGVM